MPRGVWEKVPESGIWWIHYVDAEGKRRREKVGRKTDAIKLYHQRKADAAAGKKLNKPLRQRERTFQELANNALEYARKNKSNPADDEQKIRLLTSEFGTRVAAALATGIGDLSGVTQNQPGNIQSLPCHVEHDLSRGDSKWLVGAQSGAADQGEKGEQRAHSLSFR